MSKSLDQERAAYAWKCVANGTKEYRNLAKSTPALIMSNGLMQTFAYLKAKGKDEHTALAAHVCSWIFRKSQATPVSGKVFCENFQTIMDGFVKMPAQDYRQKTEESLAILRWIRQLADAAID